MSNVLLRLNRVTAEILMDRWPGPALERVCSEEETELYRALRAALDSPPVEEASEYRVVYEERGEPDLFELPLSDPRSLAEAESRARKAPRRGTLRRNLRVQVRNVTTFADGSYFTSPWTDLEGEGEQS